MGDAFENAKIIASSIGLISLPIDKIVKISPKKNSPTIATTKAYHLSAIFFRVDRSCLSASLIRN